MNIRKKITLWSLLSISLFFFVNLVSATPLLSPNELGFGSESRSENYDELVDSMLDNGRTVTSFDNKLWVPWFSSSSSCEMQDLHRGNACNAGTIDWNHNCMVTDEFSQVGILLSMADDQELMNQFYNTVRAISSDFGQLPGWRVFRNGNAIDPCKDGINGNCDTASDANARIVLALYTASINPEFNDESVKERYADLATDLAEDMLEHEILQECKQSDLGYGDICYWLAAGSQAKGGGMSSNDFAYTGYFSDAIIAMLAACSQTGDQQYCEVAQHLTLNYLQAANFDGQNFSAPPGRSFKWANLDGVPEAQCSQGCSPVQWDDADASRAVGMCQANYYAEQMDVELPGLQEYCEIWSDRYMEDPSRAPVQYYPDGNAVNYQSSYFAQGLQALFVSGGDDAELLGDTLDNALSHYSSSTKTWDYAACFGVYHQAFPMRALGTAIGLDQAVFSDVVDTNNGDFDDNSDDDSSDDSGDNNEPSEPSDDGSSSAIQELSYSCSIDGQSCNVAQDNTQGECRTIRFDTHKGDIQIMGCIKDNDYVELYRQDNPSDAQFDACLSGYCVDEHRGFIRFSLGDHGDNGDNDNQNDNDQNNHGSSVFDLPVRVTPDGQIINDLDESGCRKVQYQTSYGWVEVKICQKDNNSYEMYLLSEPNDASVCVDNNCVGRSSGFASFSY